MFKSLGMEDSATGNNPGITCIVEKDIVDQQTKKRVQSSDSKSADPLINTTSGPDQREVVVWRENEMTKTFKPSLAERSTYEITDTPHFVIYEATMTTFHEADDSIAEIDTTEEHPSFALDESTEVPDLVSALVLQNTSDLTYVTDLSESVFSGCESDVDEFLVLNSTHEKLDMDDSTIQYDGKACSFSCISPASFNLSPVPSFCAGSCCERTYDDYRSTGQLSFESDELDSFFDLSFLQDEPYLPHVKTTNV